MNITGNAILITGGGSGIGRGLAEAFHKLGNLVIISGRRKEVLDAVVAANPGMHAMTLDIEDPESIQTFSRKIAGEFPMLNSVIHNAGIMRPERMLTQPEQLEDAEATIATNLLGPIRLNGALLPVLKRQARSTVMTVSSGLAFVPLAMTPTYCATKAAIHSYTMSLRWQLKDTTVEVVELIPPYVQTELTGPHQAKDPMAMPLADFISEVMQLIKANPNASEICVERVKQLRFAAEKNAFEPTMKGLNNARSAPN